MKICTLEACKYGCLFVAKILFYMQGKYLYGRKNLCIQEELISDSIYTCAKNNTYAIKIMHSIKKYFCMQQNTFMQSFFYSSFFG